MARLGKDGRPAPDDEERAQQRVEERRAEKPDGPGENPRGGARRELINVSMVEMTCSGGLDCRDCSLASLVSPENRQEQAPSSALAGLLLVLSTLSTVGLASFSCIRTRGEDGGLRRETGAQASGFSPPPVR